MACEFCNMKKHDDSIFDHGDVNEADISEWKFLIVNNKELGVLLCAESCATCLLYNEDGEDVEDPSVKINYCPWCGEKLNET